MFMFLNNAECFILVIDYKLYLIASFDCSDLVRFNIHYNDSNERRFLHSHGSSNPHHATATQNI